MLSLQSLLSACVSRLLALAKTSPSLTNCLLPMTKLQWGFGFLHQRGLFSSFSTSPTVSFLPESEVSHSLMEDMKCRDFCFPPEEKKQPWRATVPTFQLEQWIYVNVCICSVYMYQHTCMLLRTGAKFAQSSRHNATAEECSKCGSGASTVKTSPLHQCQKQSAWTKPAATPPEYASLL